MAFTISSCHFITRIFYGNRMSEFKGHSKNCQMYDRNDTTSINYFKKLVDITDINDNDTILSIGAGSGKYEFLMSTFTDNIVFYLEDIDTSCISYDRIHHQYIPHYSNIKGSDITCDFITITGTDSSVFISDNSVNKVFIYNAYHHFTNDIAIVQDCHRVLSTGGKLIICEHVLKRNRKSYKFCDYGGMYKTEYHFVNDIVNNGFSCDLIHRSGKWWRIFVFSKQ